jgi:hypothetical protein
MISSGEATPEFVNFGYGNVRMKIDYGRSIAAYFGTETRSDTSSAPSGEAF